MIVGLILAAVLGQTPAPQTPAATARVAGRVTVEGTNAPLADARVMLIPTVPPTTQRPFGPPPFGSPLQTVTDQEGRFAISGLGAGEYLVEIQRPGYAPVEDTGRGQKIQLADGQSIDNLQLRLQKGAVISGRILSPSGEPQADVRVLALRRIEGPSMPPRLILAPMQGMPQTNDLGEFRLAGLPPGEYYVSAAPQQQSPFGGPAVAPPSPGKTRTAVATTYYPGTSDAMAAQPVAVTRGAEVGNISFMLQSVPAFRVSGNIVDEDGKPIAGAFVTLMPAPRDGMAMGPGGSARSGDDGRFTIDNVVPGTYHANASVPIVMNRGSGGVTTWSSSGGNSNGVTVVTGGIVVGGAATTAVGGVIHQPVEVVVSDADATDVRIVVHKPQ